MSYTEGEWKYIGSTSIVACGEKRISIANIRIDGVDIDSAPSVSIPVKINYKDNARLIAAAPDLLAACKTTLPVLQAAARDYAELNEGRASSSQTQGIIEIEAAIAKAQKE